MEISNELNIQNGDIKWLLNYRIYESIITENGDIKWLLIYRIYEQNLWLLNIQNLWIDNNWEWRYQMITKYTEFMNR